MNNNEIIEQLIKQIKGQFENDSSGHDWFHIERVWKLAKQIAIKENANVFVVELGALLHDIADHKFVADFEEESIKRTKELLEPLMVNDDIIEQVQHIVLNCSFKGGVEKTKLPCTKVQGFIETGLKVLITRE